MIIPLLDRARETYMRWVWESDLSRLSRPRRWLVEGARLLHNLVRDLAAGQLTLRAMSLVYTTLLSLVPLLAVSFSVLKAFGVHNQLTPVLFNFLAPLGENGVELGLRIVSFVENMKVGVLGSLGLAMLIYTVVSLVQKIEDAFNYIWRIDRPRRFVRRFSDYMSVILIGPVLIFSALGITAAVMGTDIVQRLVAFEPIGALIEIASALLPYLLVCGAFTFIYIFIPNTKVHFMPAFAGGLIAGILWETSGWLFAAFVASSSNYTAIYSGFAVVIIFMIWLYLSWLIMLMGAQIAYYYQHPTLLRSRQGEAPPSNEARERLAIMLMLLIGYNYYYNRGLWTLERLAQEFAVAPLALQTMLGTLERRGFIAQSADDPPAYYPARDIETIRLRELVEAVRHADDKESDGFGDRPERQLVDEVMQRISGSIADALADQTVKDLVLSRARPDEARFFELRPTNSAR